MSARAFRSILVSACTIALALSTVYGCRSAHPGVTTLRIATVNNPDMVRLKSLAGEFTKANPDIRLEWVTLDEPTLRQKVTTDIALRAGQFDVVTIGAYETAMWSRQKWLAPLNNLPPSYDEADLLPTIRAALSYKGVLYASPFYAESSFTMYRKDLFARAGLTMPDRPSWAFIAKAAHRLTDPAAGVYGICLRGKAGWGENMGLLQAMSNSFGARMFDMRWRSQFRTPAWRNTMQTYVDVMRDAGPPGPAANGFTETLALFNSGKCAIWVDATVAASLISDPRASTVANKVGFAFAPDNGLGKASNWLWSWSLAIPTGSKKVAAAKRFIAWATDAHYNALVASREGWANAPPGTRTSLYANPAYLSAAPFARLTLASILAADLNHSSILPIPYVGVEYVAIPEYQGIGSETGQIFAAALSGNLSVPDALARADAVTDREMAEAGYVR